MRHCLHALSLQCCTACLKASVLNSLPTRTLYAVLNSLLSEFAVDDIDDDDDDDSCFSSQGCTA